MIAMTLAVAVSVPSLIGWLEAAETAPPPGGRLAAGPTPATPGPPLTLDDAVAMALAHSPELRALEARMAEATAEYWHKRIRAGDRARVWRARLIQTENVAVS